MSFIDKVLGNKLSLFKNKRQSSTNLAPPKLKSKNEKIVEDYLEKLNKNREYLEMKLNEFITFIENQIERSKLQYQNVSIALYEEVDYQQMLYYTKYGIDYEIDYVRDVHDVMLKSLETIHISPQKEEINIIETDTEEEEEKSQEVIDTSIYFLKEFETKQLDLNEKDLELVNGSDEIKCCTMDKWIEYITNEYDEYNLDVLLLTYKTFISSKELLDKLIIRFYQNQLEWSITIKIRNRIIKIIKYWLDHYPFDFDKDLKDKLEEFKILLKKSKSEEFIPILEKPMIQKEILIEYPKSIINISKSEELLDWNEKEIARQLTLMEMDLFKKITPNECLNWDIKNREKCPNINNIMLWFNQFSFYCSFKILTPKHSQARSLILSKIIKIAQECILLNNFNSAFELISSTTITPIHRLKKTWSKLSKQDLKLYQDLLNYISSSNNFKFLRERIFRSKSPLLPYIGLLLKDLTYIDDINQNLINGKINFYKRKQLANIIKDLLNSIKNDYHFHSIDSLLLKLKSIPSQNLDEKELLKLSLEREPKENK